MVRQINVNQVIKRIGAFHYWCLNRMFMLFSYASYGMFAVGSEDTNYTLTVGDYDSTQEKSVSDVIIGNGFLGHNFGDPIDEIFTNHNGMQFTTYDRDNDNYIGG